MADSTETRKEQRAAARAERARAEAARARTRRRLWQLGGALGVAAIVVIGIVLATSGGGSNKPKLRAGETLPGQIESNARFAGIPQNGIFLGNPKAPVTMVEFADLQCPFCQQYTTTVFPTLVADYVKTGKVRMEFRNVSILGTDSVRAAQMAGAAGLQNKLWPFIDIFYNNQGEERTGYVTDAFLMKIGSAVEGLDVTKAMNDRGIASVQKQLDTAQSEMAANGFQGTPSFLLGRTGGTLSHLTVNAFELNQFTKPIDKLLGKT